jgi:mRNA-degrading endonuclease RelE of RelBE toxin-antitoxin system
VKSHLLKSFRDRLLTLPQEAQENAKEAFRQFQTDPTYPGLHFKKVIGKRKQVYWSVRIGGSYRALATVTDGEAYWFWIGTHAEYDALLS